MGEGILPSAAATALVAPSYSGLREFAKRSRTVDGFFIWRLLHHPLKRPSLKSYRWPLSNRFDVQQTLQRAPVYTHRTEAGFPTNELCVLVMVETRVVTPVIQRRHTQTRGMQGEKLHPEKSGPEMPAIPSHRRGKTGKSHLERSALCRPRPTGDSRRPSPDGPERRARSCFIGCVP